MIHILRAHRILLLPHNILEVSALRSSLIPAIINKLITWWFAKIVSFWSCILCLSYLHGLDIYIVIYHITICLCMICVKHIRARNISNGPAPANPPPSNPDPVVLDTYSVRIAVFIPYSVQEARSLTRYWWPRRDTSQVPMQYLLHLVCELVSHYWCVLLSDA
jgi:hypothetical protein